MDEKISIFLSFFPSISDDGMEKQLLTLNLSGKIVAY